MNKRKTRDSKVPDEKLLKPIDVFNLGGEDDCFGYEYDLNADECQECGDFELCAIKFQQTMHQKRKQIEDTSSFKDLKEPALITNFELNSYVKKKLKKGMKPTKIAIMAAKKFNTEKTVVKQLIKKLK